MHRVLRPSLTTLVFALAFAGALLGAIPAAEAQGDSHDRTHFGNDINVGPSENVGDVTCFFCTVRVRGHVASDVTVFGGSIILEDEAEVEGDLTDFGSGVRLEKDVKVGGDITTFGGPVRRDPAASVGGDVTTFNGYLWLFLIFGLPLVIFGGVIALIVWVIRRFTRQSVPATA